MNRQLSPGPSTLLAPPSGSIGRPAGKRAALARFRHILRHIDARPASVNRPGEYDFLVGKLIDRDTLSLAQATAWHWGVSPHETLIALGWLSEAAYVSALAAALGLRVLAGRIVLDPLAAGHEPCQFPGLVHARTDRPGAPRFFALDATASTPSDIRALLAQTGLGPGHIVLVPRRALRAAYEAAAEPVLSDAAVNGLRARTPALSAGTPLWMWQGLALAAMTGLSAGALVVAPAIAAAVLTGAMTIPFLCVVCLRAIALGECIRKPPRPITATKKAGLRESDLPVYSILVPLFHEANMLPDLVNALQQLDYPAAKLDILLILESVDHETRAAAAGLNLPSSFRLVIVPDTKPRTKPKALNYALQLARGAYVVVYDAEDLPQPDQLKKALAGFAAGPADLACIQARLNIYNPHATWLTRQFTIEYSALFDAFLPALERLNIPVPLGGTSNHFPKRLLEELGGWDPFNVTEDADLGVRLARKGLRTKVLASTTFEEAPTKLAAWTKQRTRWLKGWMQTYLVHSRAPITLMRELGLWRCLGFHVLMGGLLLSAFVHPLFYVLLGTELAFGNLFTPPWSVLSTGLWIMAAVNLVLGYLSSMALGAMAVARRRHKGLAIHALAMPVYWLAISFAAYRALWQLIRDPYKWEKTDHAGRPRGTNGR